MYEEKPQDIRVVFMKKSVCEMLSEDKALAAEIVFAERR